MVVEDKDHNLKHELTGETEVNIEKGKRSTGAFKRQILVEDEKIPIHLKCKRIP
ncbi:hypothetical protein HHA03_11720 [Halolactibacillus halophilus]|uniref:Transposase n=1 Tax=Halolactibacillus halophilus TaxID=306540 RepID=A0ABQ0VP05_9BACI|nr:hypothetical protein [Halolactibacillus halophilus]GEM01640.1 hypothetical protein HHA03_11720 [Halolactibacillus halophilus]